MTVLAIDSATEVLSVALRHAGGTYSIVRDAGLFHSERLLPIANQVLSEADCPIAEIDLVAVSLGPGSFTGLRIGLATAKGIAAATEIPLVQVDNFAVYGRTYRHVPTPVLPLIDAKKRRFYAAAYCLGEEVFEPGDLSIERIVELTAQFESVIASGPHAELFVDRLAPTGQAERFRLDPIHRRGVAVDMLELAVDQYHREGGAAEDCSPRYVRLSDAQLSLERSESSGLDRARSD
jgi:tRNA threonylcarbamoyladenosine biosynthesis protein TsaB